MVPHALGIQIRRTRRHPMDILRAAATVLSFLCFMGILVWVLDRKKDRRFEEASQLPFLDE